MCEQDFRIYTCGCKRQEEFRQCAARAGTNVKCNSITAVELPNATHICASHMVKPNADVMHRAGQRPGAEAKAS